MTAKEYKKFKGLKKEPLRDNMTDIEVALADLGELATREIAKVKLPYGLEENMKVAREGGNIANNTRKDLENAIGQKIISSSNNIKYPEDALLIENTKVSDFCIPYGYELV